MMAVGTNIAGFFSKLFKINMTFTPKWQTLSLKILNDIKIVNRGKVKRSLQLEENIHTYQE